MYCMCFTEVDESYVQFKFTLATYMHTRHKYFITVFSCQNFRKSQKIYVFEYNIKNGKNSYGARRILGKKKKKKTTNKEGEMEMLFTTELSFGLKTYVGTRVPTLDKKKENKYIFRYLRDFLDGKTGRRQARERNNL